MSTGSFMKSKKEQFKSPTHQTTNKHSNRNNGHKVRSMNIKAIRMNTLSKTLRWLHTVRCILGFLMNIKAFWFSFWLMLSWCAECLNLPPKPKPLIDNYHSMHGLPPPFLQENLEPRPSPFFNWDSLHARLISHYIAWSYKKKKHKKLKHAENLFRKNLQMSVDSIIKAI